jgi:hypothetical protein
LADSGFSHNPESEEQSDSLERAENNGSDAEFYNVTIRRALLLVDSIAAGFILCFWGADRFDHKGALFGAVPLIVAILLAISGWFLFGATLFPASWGC